MAETCSLLDEALELGRVELRLLRDGDVEKAEETAQQRGRLVTAFLESRKSGEDPGGQKLDALRDKLRQLMALQGRLTSEARALHASVREEFKRTRQENTRLSGYGNAGAKRGKVGLLHKRG